MPADSMVLKTKCTSDAQTSCRIYTKWQYQVTGVVDPEAGVILADKALGAVLGLAKREGVEVEVFSNKRLVIYIVTFRLGMGVKW